MMRRVETSAYEVAERYLGVREVAGMVDNPLIVAMLRLDVDWPEHDEVPWCSAFVNWIAWHLSLPRSGSLRARSWLDVGSSVSLDTAEIGMDVVVLKRGGGDQPGPDVRDAPGHVGFFTSLHDDLVMVLGGNQKNSVSQQTFPVERILGIRRL